MKDNIATEPVTGAARGGSPGLWLFPVVAVGLVLYLGFSFFQRWEDGKRLAAWTRDRAVPNVSVVHPHPDAKPQILPFPAISPPGMRPRSTRRSRVTSRAGGPILAPSSRRATFSRKSRRPSWTKGWRRRARSWVAHRRRSIWPRSRRRAGPPCAIRPRFRSSPPTRRRVISRSSRPTLARPGQSRPAQGPEAIRADRCAVRRRRHRPQHRYRLFRRIRPRRPALVQGGGYSRRAHLCERAANLRRKADERHDGDLHDAAMARPEFEARVATTSNAIGAQSGSLLLELDAPIPTAHCFRAPMPMCISNWPPTRRNCAWPPARSVSANTASAWRPSMRTIA